MPLTATRFAICTGGSLFNISLALYTTGIYSELTLLQNITAISIPWRNRPYRDRNANVHHCNAETFWELLRWGRCTFHTYLKLWSLPWHARVLGQTMFLLYQKRAELRIYINQLKDVGWDSLEMYVFSYHKSFRVFTVGESDSHRHFGKKEAPYYGSADLKNIFRSRQSDLVSRQTIQLWRWNIAAGTT